MHVTADFAVVWWGWQRMICLIHIGARMIVGLLLLVSPFLWCELHLRITQVSIFGTWHWKHPFLLCSCVADMKILSSFIYPCTLPQFCTLYFLLSSADDPFYCKNPSCAHHFRLLLGWPYGIMSLKKLFVFNCNCFYVFFLALISSWFLCWLLDTWTKSWERSCKERNWIHWGIVLLCCLLLLSEIYNTDKLCYCDSRSLVFAFLCLFIFCRVLVLW